jgi:hypothetical protein
LEKLEATLKPLATGDIINLDGVQFKQNTSEMTEGSKTELRKAARLINGAPGLKFDVEVSLYGYRNAYVYRKDTVLDDLDLTEFYTDTAEIVNDSTDVIVRAATAYYHNDRTQQEALEIVNYLIEQGVPADRIRPSTQVFEAVPEERKTGVRLIARQQ